MMLWWYASCLGLFSVYNVVSNGIGVEVSVLYVATFFGRRRRNWNTEINEWMSVWAKWRRKGKHFLPCKTFSPSVNPLLFPSLEHFHFLQGNMPRIWGIIWKICTSLYGHGEWEFWYFCSALGAASKSKKRRRETNLGFFFKVWVSQKFFPLTIARARVFFTGRMIWWCGYGCMVFFQLKKSFLEAWFWCQIPLNFGSSYSFIMWGKLRIAIWIYAFIESH